MQMRTFYDLIAHLKSPSGFWCGLPIISILTKGNSLFFFSLSWKVHFGLLCPFLLSSKKKHNYYSSDSIALIVQMEEYEYTDFALLFA